MAYNLRQDWPRHWNRIKQVWNTPAPQSWDRFANDWNTAIFAGIISGIFFCYLVAM